MPVKGITPDVVDDHYYKREQGMFELAKFYDKADRKGPKIFVGEWATREGTPTPNLGAALGDAAFLTGLERNSDLVVMSAYAPLFVNVNPGGMQWSTDLIGYDALNSYGSPAYYAQVMFASCLGDQTMESEVAGAGEKFFYSVTASKGSKVCVKLVNARVHRAAGHDYAERPRRRNSCGPAGHAEGEHHLGDQHHREPQPHRAGPLEADRQRRAPGARASAVFDSGHGNRSEVARHARVELRRVRECPRRGKRLEDR